MWHTTTWPAERPAVAVELLPLRLHEGLVWRVERAADRGGSWREPWLEGGQHPLSVAWLALAAEWGAAGAPLLLRDTAWRHCPGELVLTVVAALGEAVDWLVDGRRYTRQLLLPGGAARGCALAVPQLLTDAQALQRALGQLAALASADAGVREALGPDRAALDLWAEAPAAAPGWPRPAGLPVAA